MVADNVGAFLPCMQARKDWFFIAMPNAMGVAFNMAALLLCTIFPARERQANEDSSSSSSQPSMVKRLLQSFRAQQSTGDGVVTDAGAGAAALSDLTVDVGSGSQHAHVK